MPDPKYTMTLDLNVLNHLGINLYSNIPAVLAEAVANCWDADAENVEIMIDRDAEKIVITDDGHGMSEQDINQRYLRVGYRRREDGAQLTPKHQRSVMGRKGIGKLSLFSIADVIEVQSIRDGTPNGFTMELPKIRAIIEDKSSGNEYHPDPFPREQIVVEQGTIIALRNFRKKLIHTETALRRRLARRFAVIGQEHRFSVKVNGQAIGIEDRDHFSKLQYVWHYGERGARVAEHCRSAQKREERSVDSFEGWIGTVHEAGQLKEGAESLNKIIAMARGKLVQEDILEGLGEAGLYTKYLIGEIHADHLDDDDQDDIATTSRQSIIEDDDRFVALKHAIVRELKHIQGLWTLYRNDTGTDAALENEVIKAWFDDLSGDEKKRARSLFGKIYQITVEKADERSTLFKYGVLAFESLKAKHDLDALEEASAETIVEFGKVFGHLDDIEASLYHQIVKGRISVIRALQNKVQQNELEKVIQRHLFDHLWLLDPSWERATATAYMEQQVSNEFANVTAKLSKEERRGRVDIKYRTTAGKHVIVELKRASVVTSTFALAGQINRYRTALIKVLDEAGEENKHIDIVCVVGAGLDDWSGPDGKRQSQDILKNMGARVVTYSELINNAYKAYQEYLESSDKAGRIYTLLEDIDKALGIAPPSETDTADSA